MAEVSNKISDRDARRLLIQMEIQKKQVHEKAKKHSGNITGTEYVLNEIFLDPELEIAAKIEAVKALATETEFSHIELVRIIKKLGLEEKTFAELQAKLVRALPLIFIPETIPEFGDDLRFNEEMELRLGKAVQIAENDFDFYEMNPKNFEIYAVFCSDEFLKSVCNYDGEKYLSREYQEALIRSVNLWCTRHADKCEERKAFVKKCFEEGKLLAMDPEIFDRVSGAQESIS